jgi:hypothetical protein
MHSAACMRALRPCHACCVHAPCYGLPYLRPLVLLRFAVDASASSCSCCPWACLAFFAVAALHSLHLLPPPLRYARRPLRLSHRNHRHPLANQPAPDQQLNAVVICHVSILAAYATPIPGLVPAQQGLHGLTRFDMTLSLPFPKPACQPPHEAPLPRSSIGTPHPHSLDDMSMRSVVRTV